MADEPSSELIRFYEIIEAQGHSLKQFQVSKLADLFPNATKEPNFFKQNLVSPQRVLKQFENSPQSNIKIFYFQLLRLTYQIETEHGFNRTFMNNFIHYVFSPAFEILFTQETQDQRDLFNDFQFKKLFAEFIQLLENQQTPNIERAVNSFPIIDAVFVHIIRSILAVNGINEAFDALLSTQQVFGQLGGILGLQITSYGNCWKFEDSDMFCYEENVGELYLAYIAELSAHSQSMSNETPLVGSHTDRSTDQQPITTLVQEPTTHTIEAPDLVAKSSFSVAKDKQNREVLMQTGLSAYSNNVTSPLGSPASISLAEDYQHRAPPVQYSLPAYTGFGDQGDYYRDFTDDKILDIVLEPYRSSVAKIKSRIRGLKRGGGTSSGINATTPQYTSAMDSLATKAYMSSSGIKNQYYQYNSMSSYNPVQSYGLTSNSGMFYNSAYTPSGYSGYADAGYNSSISNTHGSSYGSGARNYGYNRYDVYGGGQRAQFN